MTDDFADLDLDKLTPPDSGGPPPRNRPPVGLLVAVGVLLVALGAGYMFLRRGPSEPSVPAATAKPSVDAPVQRGEPGEQIVLPPLDETDALVRQLVDRLSSHPAVAAWLTTDGLILNFVVVTSRIATGQTPVAELKAVGPIPRFRTRSARGDVFIDPSSYRRYDRHAAAVSSLDARGTARLYATLKPRIADAYARVGPRDGEFDAVLERAIIALLEVPVVDGNVALVPHGTVYAFEDEDLQAMTAAQKQFFRMGPQNVRAVQGKLREMASALGIPESRLPPPTK
jgi:hypothetical protein